jgi:hypothetical protein
VLLGRNTVTDATTTAVDATYLEIAPAGSEPRQILRPSDGPLDRGNTGRLGTVSLDGNRNRPSARRMPARPDQVAVGVRSDASVSAPGARRQEFTAR